MWHVLGRGDVGKSEEENHLVDLVVVGGIILKWLSVVVSVMNFRASSILIR